MGSILELGRFPGGGHGNPFLYSCLDNFMDRGAWQATIHGDHKESDTTEHVPTHQTCARHHTKYFSEFRDSK